MEQAIYGVLIIATINHQEYQALPFAVDVWPDPIHHQLVWKVYRSFQ